VKEDIMESRFPARIGGRSSARRFAILGLFSALYAVFRYIPTFPMYGLPGTSFRAGDFLAPILGILLGPWLAVPCIVIGTILNYAFAPPIFLGLDFLPACVSATVAGLITSGRTKYAIALYALLLGFFLALPLSTFWIQVAGVKVPYAWLHIVALIALISPIGLRSYKWTRTSVGATLAMGVLVTVFSATMAQHLTGGILEELVLFPTFKITTASKASLFWSFIFYLYPIERLVITVVTTTFGIFIIQAIRTAHLDEVLAGIRGRTHLGSPRQQPVR